MATSEPLPANSESLEAESTSAQLGSQSVTLARYIYRIATYTFGNSNLCSKAEETQSQDHVRLYPVEFIYNFISKPSICVLYVVPDPALNPISDPADESESSSRTDVSPNDLTFRIYDEPRLDASNGLLTFIKLTNNIDLSLPISSQVQHIFLPSSAPLKVLHLVIQSAFVPFLSLSVNTHQLSSLKSDKPALLHDEYITNSSIPSAIKKLSELDLNLQHLEAAAAIPVVKMEIHPTIDEAVKNAKVSGKIISVELIDSEILNDYSFLNSLERLVARWKDGCDALVETSKMPFQGSVVRECSFWVAMQQALETLEKEVNSPSVQLTLDCLTHAKRFHTTAGFFSDFNFKEAISQARDYNTFTKDLPYNELLSASNIVALSSAILSIFNHLSKKIRASSYPIKRALALIEAISIDLTERFLKLIDGTRLFFSPLKEFSKIITDAQDLFKLWDDHFKSFATQAREISRKRDKRFIQIKIDAAHSHLQSQLAYSSKIKYNHQDFINVLERVSTFENVKAKLPNATIEVTKAFESFRGLNVLTPSKSSEDAFYEAEAMYNEHIKKIENGFSQLIRDELNGCTSTRHMFKVIAKYNSLFIRDNIHAAVRDFQNSLIGTVKHDILQLRKKYTSQARYGYDGETLVRIQLLPKTASNVLWKNQIRKQLHLCIKRLYDVLGENYKSYVEGMELSAEKETFDKILECSEDVKEFMEAIKLLPPKIPGTVYSVGIDSKKPEELLLKVNMDPRLPYTFQEIYYLRKNGHNCPGRISTFARESKQITPFATSFTQLLELFNETEDNLLQNPDLLDQLISIRAVVREYITKGLRLTWEGYLHPMTVEKTKKSMISRHMTFFIELTSKVQEYSDKSQALMECKQQIENILLNLKHSSYSNDDISMTLNKLQLLVKNLTNMNLDNIDHFIEYLNKRVGESLLERIKIMSDVWLKCFCQITLEEGSIEKDIASNNTISPSDHQILFKDGSFQIFPQLELAKNVWIQSHDAWLSPFLNQTEIQNVYEPKVSDFSYLYPVEKYPEVLEAMDAQYKKLQDYLDEWLKFQILYKIEFKEIEISAGQNFKVWSDVVHWLQRMRRLLKGQGYKQDFVVASIDFSTVYEIVSTKLETWIRKSVFQLIITSKESMQTLYAEILETRLQLEALSLNIRNPAETIDLALKIHKVESSIGKWSHKVEELSAAQNLIFRETKSVPKDWFHIERLASELTTLKTVFERKTDLMQNQELQAQELLQKTYRGLTQDCELMSIEWRKTKESDSLRREPRLVLDEILDLEKKLDKAFNMAISIEKAARVLNLILPSDSLQLKELHDEVKDHREVWNSLIFVSDELLTLGNRKFNQLPSDQLQNSLESLLSKIKVLPSRLRSYTPFDLTIKEIQLRITEVPVIQMLQRAPMKDRHWTKLFRSFGKQYLPERISIQNLWDINLLVNKSQIQSFTERAQGEYSIEKFIKEIDDFWASFTLEFVLYQKRIWLVKSWPIVIEKSSEHISSLDSISRSPYFGYFEGISNQWKEKLNSLFILSEQFLDIQRQWIYFDGIFNGTNQITQLLPREYSRFSTYSSELNSILKTLRENQTVFFLTSSNNVAKLLQKLTDGFQRLKHTLITYLEKERELFPRYYLLGDDELLELLGGNIETLATSIYLNKMLPGIQSLCYETLTQTVNSVRSPEDEIIQLRRPTIIKKGLSHRNVLESLEKSLKDTLSIRTLSCYDEFKTIFTSLSSTEENGDNIFTMISNNVFQSLFLAVYLHWTASLEAIYSDDTDDFTVKGMQLEQVRKKYDALLTLLSEICKRKLSRNLCRRKVENFTTLIVNIRKVLSRMEHLKLTSIDDYRWLYLIRYYLSSENKIIVKIGHASFPYDYEYFGVPDLLVRTELTDQCFAVMAEALNRGFGGSPLGPAGTGKTETVKALGMHLGKFVLVFNCDHNFDFRNMSRILTGLCQIGAWGCFDEFNRLDENMLSAVSQLIQQIQVALISQEEKDRVVFFDGKTLKVNESTGIFVTMNPHYATRSKLPANLERLLRSILMSKPDTLSIAEVLLFSKGFDTSFAISQKIVSFFEKCKEELSDQIHYDFGLRALKTFLRSCGTILDDKVPDLEGMSIEDTELMSCVEGLHDTLVPKLISDDRKIFDKLVSEYFPESRFSTSISEEYARACREIADTEGLELIEEFLVKVTQINSMMKNHQGIILYGSSDCGKTTTRRFTKLLRSKLLNKKIKEHNIDPKSLTMEKLYGSIDPVTREWSDGVITSIFRKQAIDHGLESESETLSQSETWIIFDGDIDPIWAENLNSVLDDNKVLTLPNGERLPLSRSTRIIFEVDSLLNATPATITRCGMIWFPADGLTIPTKLSHSIKSWMKKATLENTSKYYYGLSDLMKMTNEAFFGLFDSKSSFYQIFIDQLEDNSSSILGRAFLGAKVQTFLSIMSQAIADILEYNNTNEEFPLTNDQSAVFIQKSAIIALIWSLCSDLKESKKAELIGKIKNVLAERDSFSDLVTQKDLLSCNLKLPESKIECLQVTEADNSINFKDLTAMIITPETLRIERLINCFLNAKKPLLLCGPAGSGKTMIMLNTLRNRKDVDVAMMNFSSETTPEQIIRVIEQHCVYRRDRNLIYITPKLGKTLVLFCDEVNLPRKDTFGCQKAIMALRQLIAYKGFWSSAQGLKFVHLENIQIMASCNPSSYIGRIVMSDRFLRLTSILHVNYPSTESLTLIFSKLFKEGIHLFPQYHSISNEIVSCMIDFYSACERKFRRDNQNIYTPRDLSRWIRSIIIPLATGDDRSISDFLDLIVHEGLRLFSDRLSTLEQKEVCSEQMFASFDRLRISDTPKDLIFSSWMSSRYASVDLMSLKQFVTSRFKTYNEEEGSICTSAIIIFDEFLKNLLRVERIFHQIQGHLMIVGPSGMGKRTMVQFASWMSGIQFFEIHPHRAYTSENFDEDLRKLLILAGLRNIRVCFFIDESSLLDTSYLERMNTLLANSEIPGLFEEENYVKLISDCRKTLSDQDIIFDSEEDILVWFIDRIRTNLHVIFSFDSDTFSNISGALVNRCTLNWLGDWTNSSLAEIADSFVHQIDAGSIMDSNLSSTKDERRIQSCLVQIFRSVQSVPHFNNKHSTLSMFIKVSDFFAYLQNFRKFFETKKANMEGNQRNIYVGLEKISQSVETIQKLRADLEVKGVRLQEKSEAADFKLQQIIKETEHANERQTSARELEKAVLDKMDQMEDRKKIVSNDLEKVLPAVEAAQNSVSNIRKQNLTELRSMSSPVEIIRLVLEAVCVLLGYPVDSWRAIQTVIRKDDFIPNVVNFKTDTISINRAKIMRENYLSKSNFNVESAMRASKACGPLLEWVLAQVNFATIMERVEPLKEEIAALEEQADEAKARVSSIKVTIEENEKLIKKYKQELNQFVAEHESLKLELKQVNAKIERSERFISNLSFERSRWTQTSESFNDYFECLIGDTILAASYETFMGYISYDSRITVLQEWRNLLKSNNISCTVNFDYLDFINDVPEFSKLHTMVQVTDFEQTDISLQQNLHIVKNSPSVCLLIDPSDKFVSQFLAQKQQKITVTSFLDPNYVKLMESCMRFGTPILLQDADNIDPIILPILRKDFRQVGGRRLVSFGSTEIDISPSFEMLLTTRNSDVSLDSKIASILNIVRLSSASEQIQSLSLETILQTLVPDLFNKKKSAIKSRTHFAAKLRSFGSTLLKSLNEAKGQLLEDESLIDSLEQLQADVKATIAESEEAQKIISEVHSKEEEYERVSQICHKLYETVSTLPQLHSNYQVSAEFFIFNLSETLKSFKDYQKSHLGNGQVWLTERLFQKIFEVFSKSLKSLDGLIFAILLSICKERYSSPSESGLGTSLKELLRLDMDSQFEPIKYLDSIKSLVSQYSGTSNYVGKIFETQRSFRGDFRSIASELPTSSMPIAVLTERQAACTETIEMLAKESDIPIATVPLGSLESERLAEHNVKSLCKQKHWVLLVDVHYSSSWLKNLEEIVRELQPHPEFRLIFTADFSDPSLPKSLLRMSRVVVCETSQSLKTSMLELMRKLSKSSENIIFPLPIERARVYLMLAWLHESIIERQKLDDEWKTNELRIKDIDLIETISLCDLTINRKLHIDPKKIRQNMHPEEIPWESFRWIANKVIYGSLMDHDYDKQILNKYSEKLLDSNSFEADFSMSFSEQSELISPLGSTTQDILDWIHNLPNETKIEWFGLEAKSADQSPLSMSSLPISKLFIMKETLDMQ